jgi:uncharacterized protein (TIGR00299 family) protein
MGNVLFLEPIGGIAGDMFLAAAIDMGVSKQDLERVFSGMAHLGFRLDVTRAEDSGISGTHLEVVPLGPQPQARALSDIRVLVDRAGLPARARDAALAVFDRIGRAEAKVHAVSIEQIHFHEVGAIDSIVDVCGAVAVLDLLGWPRLVSAVPELGQGMADMAHGRMPVPPPAVLEILQGTPVRMGGPPGEAVTPTGAAILAVLCEVGTSFSFTPRRTGYGVGTRRWPDRPNVLRMTEGDIAEATPARRLVVIEANLDDCSGQLVARVIEVALEAGALDAWASPVTMKKGRPGIVLGALVNQAHREAVAKAFFEETTTLGVRFRAVDREELDREMVEVETPYGAVRVKLGKAGGRVISAHPEYDDCLVRAKERGVAVKEVMAAALAVYRSR